MKLMRIALVCVGWCFVSCVLMAGAARAAEPLRAEDLLLVYNRLEPAGAELAEHYAKVRQVPADRICGLELRSKDDEISRSDFERLIRTPIRNYLTKHGLRDKVRCLVTFYGVPIRVGEHKEWPDADKLHAKWQKEMAEGFRSFDQMIRDLQSIAGGPTTLPTSQPNETEFNRLLRAYLWARQVAYEHVTRLRAKGGGEEELRRFVAIMQQTEGMTRMVSFLTPTTGVDQATAEQQLDAMRLKIRGEVEKAYDLLAGDPRDPARDAARMTLGQYAGLIVYLSSLQNDLARLETEKSEASVDSELMLLWWRVYPRANWVWNPLCWRNRADPGLANLLPPGDRDELVLIVARLDAPTPSVVRRMIDDSVTTEKQGLAGRFYIDARGLKPDKGLGSYDENLRELAELVRGAGMPVTLDNNDSVFAPRTCPDAALYCGWYSLRKYVDAFTFVPGAVGFHIASFEAISLRKPNETGWCRGLLRDGVAATIGPVAEPYLQSFPRPVDFFGLLLSGRFTLGECYAYGLPFTSWMQMLLGDPLYKPFAAKPMLALEQVFPENMILEDFRPSTK